MSDPSDSRRTERDGDAPDVEPRLRLSIDVVHENGDWTAFEPVEEAADAVAAEVATRIDLPAETNSVCIALSNDAHVASLNSRYRGKTKPTNVLSFPGGEVATAPVRGTRVLGDIVLAVETIHAEAAAQGIQPRDHLKHLIVHGLLHLLGFDHETEEEAREMEALEVEILAALGVADPYADGEMAAGPAHPAGVGG